MEPPDPDLDPEARLLATPIASFAVPWGAQEFQLQQLEFGGGGARLMRLRIREGRRFTVVDLDAVTVRELARAMGAWSDGELALAQR
jgi:hypothetical protein